MSLILVVEQEGRYIERVHDALAAEGWRVKVVNGRESALQAAASEAPALVLVNSDLPDAVQLLDQFSRHRGGPGTVALVPERSAGRVTAQELGADDLLAKPFTDQDLRLLVRRALAVQREARPAAPSTAGRQLTSEDIFGDVLAEMESDAAPAKPAASPARTGDAMQRRLEQTLSGLSLPQVKSPAAPKPSPPKSTGPVGIDKLISDTLSGLDQTAKSSKTAAAKPAPPSAPSAPGAVKPEAPPAPLAPPVMQMAPVAPALPPRMPEPIAPAPAKPEPVAPAVAAPSMASPLPPPVVPDLPRPPAIPSAPPAALAGAASEVSKARRTGEIDLAQLDQLARPRTKTGTAAKPSASPAPSAPPVSRPAPAESDGLRTQRLPSFSSSGSESREFGQYTLLDRIAVGGMAEVWKARMKGVEGFQKTVAIKRILPSLTDSADFVTMFIDEAKLAAQLQHNNIIHIYDLGKLGDDFYIAMEYVEGKDLRTILNTARSRQAGLPQELALLVAARLASALDYAHRKRDFDNRALGLVHRDVSPQNVLISYEGDIKLCDFGIVKAVSKASKTQMGALKGKLQYMSPEQAWGKPVDARSDIFSLGSVLFEMLTGRRLFAGDSEISVLEAVRDCRVEHPQSIEASIPAEIDALVMKALAREPEDRFASAGAMQKEIERVLQVLRRAPSQADLAGYMHRLFGDEARVQEAAAGAPLAVWGGAPGADAGGAVAALSASGSQVRPIAAPPGATGVRKLEGEGKGRAMLWVAIAAAALAGVGIYFWLERSKTPAPPPPNAETPAATAAATPGETPAAGEGSAATAAAPAPASGTGTTAPTGASGATLPAPALGQRVDQAVAQREAQLKQQFEAEKKRLAEQIAQTKAAPGAKPAAAGAAATAAAEAAKLEQDRLAAEKAEQDRLAAEKAEQDRLAAEKAEADRKAQEAAQAAATAAPVKPAAPAVQLGDLVQPGQAGVVPPSLVSRPQPSYPPLAKQMRVEGDVIVEVLVDENGAIRDSRLLKSVPQLDSSALAAARSAKFRPATKDGVRVKMWFRLNFPFRM